MDQQLMLADLSVIEFAGLILLILIAVGLFYLVANLVYKLQSPYVEGKVGFWRIKSIEGVFHHKTIGGFHIAYRLSGLLTRVDNYQFAVEAMLEEENQYKPLSWFNLQPVKNQLIQFPFGKWFLVYAWTNYCEPYAFAYKKVNDESFEYELDANQVDLVKAANARAEKSNLNLYGCTFELLVMDLLVGDPDSIEANYNMLTKEQRQSAENDPKYLKAEEHAVVAALKRRLDLHEPSKIHQSSGLTIISTVVDQTVKIEWDMKADLRDRYEVKGFRKEGGFHTDKWSETRNGDLIAHSSTSGSTVDHPPADSIQFYTFMLARTTPEGETEYRDSIRFQVRIPKESDVELLKKALEANKAKSAPASPSPSVLEKEVQRRLKEIDEGVARVLISQDKKDELIAKVQKMQLPEDAQSDVVQIITDWYNNEVDQARWTTLKP